MTSTVIPSLKIPFSDAEIDTISEHLRVMLKTGQLSGDRYIQDFEAGVRELTGRKHALAVSSGGAALQLAYRALSDQLEVGVCSLICPTNTFVATASEAALADYDVVLADVDPVHGMLTLETLKKAMQQVASDAVVVSIVHIGGNLSPDFMAIAQYCFAHHIPLVEDCAHALGTGGSAIMGTVSCFSFYATKPLTTGEGGMVVTDDDEIAAYVLSCRDYGRTVKDHTQFQHIASNYRMSGVAGIIGAVKLPNINADMEGKSEVAEMYKGAARSLGIGSSIARFSHDCMASQYKYIVPLGPEVKCSTEHIYNRMKRMGTPLPGTVYSTPLHQQEVANHFDGVRHYPGAGHFCARHICLPNYASLSLENVYTVLKNLLSIFAGEGHAL